MEEGDEEEDEAEEEEGTEREKGCMRSSEMESSSSRALLVQQGDWYGRGAALAGRCGWEGEVGEAQRKRKGGKMGE